MNMKTNVLIKMSLLASLLLLVTVALSSCDKDKDSVPTPETISGTWVLNEFDFDAKGIYSGNINYVTSRYSIKSNIPGAPSTSLGGSLSDLGPLSKFMPDDDSLIELASWPEALRTFTFNSDGSLTTAHEGKYRYNLSGNKVTIITKSEDDEATFEVVSLSSKQMKIKLLSVNLDGGSKIASDQLSLTATLSKK